MNYKCPQCGKFVSKAVAHGVGDSIEKVEANCKKCGVIEVEDWEYDDFFYIE